MRKLSQGKFRMNRPVKTKSGMLLTTQEEQMQGWEEKLSEMFNKDDDINNNIYLTAIGLSPGGRGLEHI